jgi:hypothetical protein
MPGQEHDTAGSKQPAVPNNSREWKQLRVKARSQEDFQALSTWCESQAEACRKKQANYETELREYYEKYCCFNPIKSRPRRDEILNNEIRTCKKEVKRWSDLAILYAGKAKALEAASIGK